MPYFIIKFKLPQEQEELETTMNAGKMASLIDEWENHLRHKIKYEELNLIERKIYDKIRESWFEVKDAVGL